MDIRHYEMYEQGVKYYKEVNFAEAILCFRKAIEYFPNDWSSWVRLSLACVRQGMIDKSDSLFLEAFASAQRGIKHLFESGNLLDNDDDDDDYNIKLEGFEKQGYSAASYVLGVCYLEYFGDRPKAIKQYDLVVQIDPKFAGRLREIIFK